MHAFTAPEQGSGKSFLVDCCATLATGFRAPVISIGKDETELEKRLGAVLIAGYPIISLDNCSRPLRGDFLCEMLERPALKVRVLGLSKDVHIEPQLIAFATGNNLVLIGDVIRRTIVGRLDAGCEDPDLRQFACDPLRLIVENRGKYLAAVLTIIRAFQVSGEDPSRRSPHIVPGPISCARQSSG